MPGYMGHASKRAIREHWCKPLLGFLHDELGCKLTYLGLPSPEAHDILCWIEYLDNVIAFQCREYPNPSSAKQTRDDVLKLENKLLELERSGRLSAFAVYDGYIEEVLIKGRDTAGEQFGQEDFITVYNLDFCNSIATPLRYIAEDGSIQSAFKSQAIRELLNWQRRAAVDPGKFVMFLTLHSSFLADEEARYLKQEASQPVAGYLKKISRQLHGPEKSLRTLRTYVYQLVTGHFSTFEFTPELLPTIYYEGAGENWLVHFTVVGTLNRNPSGLASPLQSPESVLNQKFLWVNRSNSICLRNTEGMSESNAHRNAIDALKASQVFQRYWQ